MSINAPHFASAFEEFKRSVIAADKGKPFVSFDEGLVAVWESSKPKLREVALKRLKSETWNEADIGSGKILEHTINAIEINDSPQIRNYLVLWDGRYGEETRAHQSFILAKASPEKRQHIEQILYDLFCFDDHEGLSFDRLAQFTKNQYRLLAYLYFLKDSSRFLPILPTTFDQAFRRLGIDIKTRSNCTWENYSSFLGAIGAIHEELQQQPNLANCSLLDAHSFCWMLIRLPQERSQGNGKQNAGRLLGAKDKCIIAMKNQVISTVSSAHGQKVENTKKNKELRMTEMQLEQYIEYLLDDQDDLCALTGLPLQYDNQNSDKQMLPSLDRIESNGHYEQNNLQVVCRFINFWKGSMENEEFIRLLETLRES